MAQNSYQLLDFSEDVVLTWPFSYSGTYVLNDWNDMDPSTDGLKIFLPQASLTGPGQVVVLNNISTYTLSVFAYDQSTELWSIEAGGIVDVVLYDSSTDNGLWRFVPRGSGYSAIVALQAASSDDSILITNGDVTSPGGAIDFQLPTSLYNLNTLITDGGFPVITASDPFTWQTVELVGGENIAITNADGIAGEPIINLSNVVTNISSIEVGNMTLSGDIITNNSVNGNIQVNTNGTGKAQINGVEIDVDGNITGITSIAIPGIIDNDFIPKAFCSFSDTITGESNTIVVTSAANVSSVTGSNGTYVINFETALSSTNYGVTFGLGSTGGALPFISNAYYIVKETTSVTIVVTDASGELVLSAPNGITVTIMLAN